jgi:flagellar hook-associated protein 1 FlgK
VLGAGDQPNDLLDERDRLLDKLAELAGAESHTQANGEAIVSIGGHALVVGRTTFGLQTVPDAANSNLSRIVWADGQPFAAPRGELVGLLDARDRVIPAQQTGLNNLAATLINEVNRRHRAGFGLNNATGLDFFAGTDAMSIRLNAPIADPVNGLTNIATATTANAPGDGNVARDIFEIQQDLTMNGGTATLNQFFTAQVGQLGLELRHAGGAAADRALVAESLDRQRDSIGGVNLDEEAANLAQSQRAYEAAARVMTAVDDMIDRIINGMGRVGL